MVYREPFVPNLKTLEQGTIKFKESHEIKKSWKCKHLKQPFNVFRSNTLIFLSLFFLFFIFYFLDF